MSLDRCPPPTVKKFYGAGFGMEWTRPALSPVTSRPVAMPDPVPPTRRELIALTVLSGLLFVLAYVLASFARFIAAF